MYSVVSFMRPNDVLDYLGNDVLGAATGASAALNFGSVSVSQGHLIFTSSFLRIDRTGIIAGETSYALHIYAGTPPSALGDNAPFDLPAGDRSLYLGSIPLGTLADLGSTLWVEADSINKQRKLPQGVTNIFGYLVTAGGYKPAALTVHTIGLFTVPVYGLG